MKLLTSVEGEVPDLPVQEVAVNVQNDPRVQHKQRDQQVADTRPWKADDLI